MVFKLYYFEKIKPKTGDLFIKNYTDVLAGLSFGISTSSKLSYSFCFIDIPNPEENTILT